MKKEKYAILTVSKAAKTITIIHVKNGNRFIVLPGELTLEEAAVRVNTDPTIAEIAFQGIIAKLLSNKPSDVVSIAGDMFQKGVQWAREHPGAFPTDTKK